MLFFMAIVQCFQYLPVFIDHYHFGDMYDSFRLSASSLVRVLIQTGLENMYLKNVNNMRDIT